MTATTIILYYQENLRGWWAREDSNLQPSGYEPLALTIELRARAGAGGNARYII